MVNGKGEWRFVVVDFFFMFFLCVICLFEGGKGCEVGVGLVGLKEPGFG